MRTLVHKNKTISVWRELYKRWKTLEAGVETVLHWAEKLNSGLNEIWYWLFYAEIKRKVGPGHRELEKHEFEGSHSDLTRSRGEIK